MLTDTEGDTHTFDCVLDVEALEWRPYVEMTASYQIRYEDELLLETVLHDVQSQVNLFSDGQTMLNGYYAVDITLSEAEQTKAFLTGLTDQKYAEGTKRTGYGQAGKLCIFHHRCRLY